MGSAIQATLFFLWSVYCWSSILRLKSRIEQLNLKLWPTGEFVSY